MRSAIRNRNLALAVSVGFMLTITVSSTYTSVNENSGSDFTEIDTYVEEQMDAMGLPGLSLGVVLDGQIAHLKGFGVADSSGRAVTPQTPFRIGSLTKSFTALAVMQLVEAEEIDLDTPVINYLPWFQLADPAASAKITVRHLLIQTSGISQKDGNSLWASNKSLEQVVREMDALELTKPVGSTYQYSNLNYMIAGLIVEAVSGQPYDTYVTEHIFEPLEMPHSHASLNSGRADGLAKGYLFMFGRPWQNDGPIPPANLPAGTLMVSAEDMTHYAIAQMNEGRFGETSILSPHGITELHAPAAVMAGDEHYAMGWNTGEWEGKTYISHAGDDGRFHSVIFLFPGQKTGLVLLTNATGFIQSAQIDQLALGVLLLLHDQPAASVSAPFQLVFLYWLLLLTPSLQVLGILFILRRIQRVKVWWVILVSVVYLGTFLLQFQLALQTITLPSMLVFFPDLGFSLVAVASLAIGWSVIFFLTYLIKRKAKSEIQPV